MVSLLILVMMTNSMLMVARSQEEDCPVSCKPCSCYQVSAENDEWGLTCNNYYSHPSDGLPYCLNSTQIVHLSVNKGSLGDLNETFFAGVPNLKTMEIEDNEVARIAEGTLETLPYLENLILPGNIMEVTLHYSFTNVYLKELDVSRNKMPGIGDNQLTMLKRLKKFDMSGNLISSIGSQVFTDQENLQELILSNNIISQIDKDAFSLLVNVRTLKLDGNRLLSIESGTFDKMTYMEELALQHNSLSTLPDTLFEKCLNLKNVDLSNNLFADVPSNTLSNSATLQSVNMDANTIQVLITKAFAEMTDLLDIKLSYLTSLLEVGEKAFMNMNQLETINMTNNPYLDAIHAEAFHSTTLGSLKSLYLSNNGLRKLEQQWFMDKLSLMYAEVHGNQLQCSCDAQWIRVNMEDTEIQWIQGWKSGETAVKCYSPDNLRDMDVHSIDVSDFTCEKAQVLDKEISFENGNTLTLTAVVHLGLPSTQWILPSGETVTNENSQEKATHERLSNNSILATLQVTDFVSSMQGFYVLTASNAGGDVNATYDITPDVPGFPSGLSGGQIVGIVFGVIIGCLIVAFVSFLFIKRRIGYTRMENEPSSGFSGSSRGPAQYQEQVENVTSSQGVPKYGGTSEQDPLTVDKGQKSDK